MIRDFQMSDLSTLKEVYSRRGLGFGLPDFSREMAVAKVYCADGQVVMAGLLRPTTEAYMICDQDWDTPWNRWQVMQRLHEAILDESRKKGVVDTQAVLDPPIERAFGKRLLMLGWRRHAGVLYSREAG
jgi:hypothetical protein